MTKVEKRRFSGHFEEMGTGPPLLCCPGFGCSNWIFKDLALAMESSARWIMPDPRGMGLSPKAHESYTIADLADDGSLLMDDLGHERFWVMGISMGGFIAQSLALAHPNRVSGLLLLCTTGPGPDFPQLPELEEPLLRAWYDMDPATVVRANTDATVHPGLKRRNPQRYLEIVDAKLRHRAELDQVLLQREATRTYLKEARPLERIACPTLVLCGENDRFVVPESSRLLAEKIPGAELRLFPQSDHLFFLEKTAEVTAAIREFLESL